MIDPITGETYGAACDNLLIANPVMLTASEWVAKQIDWINSGQAIECTTSQTLGDIKGEIEKLCSVAKCDYATQQAITSGLSKIQTLGKKAD